MVLYLIGLGIDYRLNLPIEVLNEIRRCKAIYWENYTSPAPYSYDDIVKLIKRKVKIIKRSDFENSIENIVRNALNHDLAILVNGDPLVATTHSYIAKIAKVRGVELKIFHNSSILSAAVGESGLHVYKFGASGTIVRENKASNKRNSDILMHNLTQGFHTFFYLEYDHDEPYIMDPYEALKQLEKYPVVNILGNINPYVIILCGIGYNKSIRKAFRYTNWRRELSPMRELIKKNKLPCVVIIVGELHFSEEEYIKEVLGDNK